MQSRVQVLGLRTWACLFGDAIPPTVPLRPTPCSFVRMGSFLPLPLQLISNTLVPFGDLIPFPCCVPPQGRGGSACGGAWPRLSGHQTVVGVKAQREPTSEAPLCRFWSHMRTEEWKDHIQGHTQDTRPIQGYVARQQRGPDPSASSRVPIYPPAGGDCFFGFSFSSGANAEG